MNLLVFGKEKPYVGKEDNFQKSTKIILQSQYPDLYKYATHSPNGGKRPVKTFIKKGRLVSFSAEGKKLKEMGTKPGVSDWLILYPNKKYHGLFIELKVKGGTLQQSQIDFLKRQAQVGFYCAVCYSLEAFETIIKSYLSE